MLIERHLRWRAELTITLFCVPKSNLEHFVVSWPPSGNVASEGVELCTHPTTDMVGDVVWYGVVWWVVYSRSVCGVEWGRKSIRASECLYVSSGVVEEKV